MAFLSLLDERARPKGSRDPLGFELVWTYFGRKVVGNLTTITSSWRIFSVGLLGFHWCNQFCRDVDPVQKQKVLQQHFIRYEQLAAFLRCIAGDEDIMGINRVRQRLSEQSKQIHFGNEQEHLILSDQISYGIWGLYSTALRESGLVSGDYRELTEKGLAIVSQIESSLDRDWYWGFVRGDKKAASIDQLESEGKRFVSAITRKSVKDGLITALLKGSGRHECQNALYQSVQKVDVDILNQGNLSTLILALKKHSDSAELKQALDEIAQIERLLVTANILFNYCRRKDGQSLEGVAKAIERAYDFSFLPKGPSLDDCPYAGDLNNLRTQLQQGQALEALRSLLALNKKIMDGRGGAAWAEEAHDGTLRVRVNSETAQLVPQDALQSDWDYDYFLRSFGRIAAMERQ